jgi:hypothetical protein
MIKTAKSRVSLLAASVALAALTGAALASTTEAQAAPAPAPAPVAKATTVSHANTLTPSVKRLQKGTGVAAEGKALATYWTPARMKSAVSLDKIAFSHPGTAPQKAQPSTPQGSFGSVAPKAPKVTPKVVERPRPVARTSSFYPGLPYYHPTARTNGKVFFTRGGANYVCSGSVVNSEGKSLVWTAGHCVVDGQVWDSNFAFVPSYSNGSRPYGTWYSRQLTTTSGWYFNRDFSQDVAGATMYRNYGYRIADYLGSQGLMWNQSTNYYACAFGYPQASPYTGAYLTEVCGSTYSAGNGTIYMYSGLTGGSSGGPWLRNYDGNYGYVNGHNDFIYTSSPAWMYSPYYGNQVASLYGAVRNLTS